MTKEPDEEPERLSREEDEERGEVLPTRLILD
jgi:hypothetical protein